MITGKIYYGYNITGIVESTMNSEVHDVILNLIDGGYLEGDVDEIDSSPIYVGSCLGSLSPEDVLSIKYLINVVSQYKNDELVTRMICQLKSKLDDVDQDVEVFAALVKALDVDDRDIFIVWDK